MSGESGAGRRSPSSPPRRRRRWTPGPHRRRPGAGAHGERRPRRRPGDPPPVPRGPVVAVVGSGNNGGDALVALRSLRAWGRDVAWPGRGLPRPRPASSPASTSPASIRGRCPPRWPARRSWWTGSWGRGRRASPGSRRRPDPAHERQRPPHRGAGHPQRCGPHHRRGPGRGRQRRRHHPVRLAEDGRPVPAGPVPVRPDRRRGDRVPAAGARGGGADGHHAGLGPGPAPGRAPDAHKNSVGRVLVVAGREGVAGPRPSPGARRSGRGPATSGSRRWREPDHPPDAGARSPVRGSIGPGALREAVAESDAVLMGPGWDGPEAAAVLDLVLDALAGRRGCVLDADALTLLARRRTASAAWAIPALLTPHPGEMSRITGLGRRRRSGPTPWPPPGPGQPNGRGRPAEGRAVRGGGAGPAGPGGRARDSSDLATAGMGDQLGAAAAAFLAAGAIPPPPPAWPSSMAAGPPSWPGAAGRSLPWTWPTPSTWPSATRARTGLPRPPVHPVRPAGSMVIPARARRRVRPHPPVPGRAFGPRPSQGTRPGARRAGRPGR
jgi:NAD(P)H-hydrate repair Nnr-like enzyme with NAD(P)H-hydrate dehydratase domain